MFLSDSTSLAGSLSFVAAPFDKKASAYAMGPAFTCALTAPANKAKQLKIG